MKKLMANRIGNLIVLMAVCIASSILGFALGGSTTIPVQASQTQLTHQITSQPTLPKKSDIKMIEREKFDNELVEIEDLSVKDIKIKIGQTFSASNMTRKSGGQTDDWLENLQYSIKNTSEKQIIHLRLELSFLETMANGHPIMVYNNLLIGIDPRMPPNVIQQSRPLSLSPGESVTFKLSPNQLKSVKEFLAFGGFQLADLNQVTLRTSTITFNDGIWWNQGNFYRPNPSAPNGFERINQ
jgi:hypothetical protein